MAKLSENLVEIKVNQPLQQPEKENTQHSNFFTEIHCAHSSEPICEKMNDQVQQNLFTSSDALLFEELIQNPTSGDRIQENSNQFAENILEADI